MRFKLCKILYGLGVLAAAVSSGCGVPVRIEYHDRALEAKLEEEFSTRSLASVEGFWQEKDQYGETVGAIYKADPATNCGFPFASRLISYDLRVPLAYRSLIAQSNERVGCRLKPTDDPRVYKGETLIVAPGRGEYWQPVTVTLTDPTTWEGVVHTTESLANGNTRRRNLIGPKKELELRLAAISDERSRAATRPANPAAQPSLVGGSGFLISSSLVITNQHVIAQAKAVRCFVAGEQVSANVIARDNGNDLAVLRLDTPAPKRVPALYIGDSSRVRIGARVFALGYPMTDVLGTDVRLHTGVISSLSGFQGTTGEFQLEMSVNPGDSGGPVLDETGSVIGIMASKIGIGHTLKTGNIAGGIAFAIKAEFLRSIVNAAEVSGELTGILAEPAPAKMEEMVSSLRDAVVRIEVER